MSKYKLTSLLKENAMEQTLKGKISQMVGIPERSVYVRLNPISGEDSFIGTIQFMVKDDIDKGKFDGVVSFLEQKGFKITSQEHQFDYEDDRYNYPTIKFEGNEGGEVNENLTNEDEIRDILMDYGSEEEINQYLDSLEFTGEEFDSMDDYVEDFQLYLADKSL